MREKAAKSKMIQQEQKRQIQSKMDLERKLLSEDVNAFKNDVDATAVYYINEDKRKEREKALKGSGQKIAHNLQNQFYTNQEANRQRMMREAEERKLAKTQMVQEDAEKKLKILEKKQRLREIQEKDKLMKLEQ